MFKEKETLDDSTQEEYLMRTVFPLLIPALKNVLEKKPETPLIHLAH